MSKVDLVIWPNTGLRVAIDATTVRFDSSTEGYKYDDYKSFNCVAAVLIDQENAEKIVDAINANYASKYLEPGKAPKYAHLSEVQYGKHKGKKKLVINERSGMAGLRNPMAFELQAYEEDAHNRAGFEREEDDE